MPLKLRLPVITTRCNAQHMLN